MRYANVTQPDITLLLDLKGVIREAKLSGEIGGEAVDGWIGRPWTETVTDIGVDKVNRMVEEAFSNRVSIFHEITQRFPDGREVLFEYTTVRLGGNSGLIAVGKSLRVVVDLQDRVIAAQQALERDYWKLNQVEARQQPPVTDAKEAVLLIRDPDFDIIEANPSAVVAFGLVPGEGGTLVGRDLMPEIAENDREVVRSTLKRVRENGSAPRFLTHLGRHRKPWLVRATLVAPEPAVTFLLQLSPAETETAVSETLGYVSVDELIERLPDGFAIFDRNGKIIRCNAAFLDLLQMSTKAAVVGENFGRWLAKPGTDLQALISTLYKHGTVKRFEAPLVGEYGGEILVEISAASNANTEPNHIAVIVRDVSRRLTSQPGAQNLGRVLSELHRKIGTTPLRTLMKNVVGVVECFYIEDALVRTGGNRTAAAEMLGLSRQNLYNKIDRYGLDGALQADRPRGG
jgi:transcriptional regulator PpsR